MAILAQLNADSTALTISVSGDFVLTDSDAFKDAYLQIKKMPQQCFIDLQETNYIDSTALAMLLEFREYARRVQTNIHIMNMNDVVLEIFRVLNFHKIFKPEYEPELRKVVWSAHYNDGAD